MFCRNCGSNLKEGSRFCAKCGWPVDEDGTEGGFAAENTPVSGIPGKRKGFSIKRLSGKKPLLILAPVVLVLVLVFVFGNFSVYASNFFRRTFSSPEKYFQYVMGQSLREDAKTISNLYGNLCKERCNFSDKTVKGEVVLELEEEGRRLAQDLPGMDDDLEWLDRLSLSAELSVKDQIASGTADLKLGADELISANAAVDIQNGAAYVQIPVLTDKYLRTDSGSLGFVDIPDPIDMQEALARADSLYENYPDKMVVERLLYKYASMAAGSIGTVEKHSATLTAGRVSQKCTVLTAALNSKALQASAKRILNEMKSDRELREVIRNISLVEGQEYFYEYYEALIDDLLRETDYIPEDERVLLNVSVNNKGEIIGFQVQTNDEFELSFACPKKDSRVGCEIVYSMDGTSYTLTGTGAEAGQGLSLDFEVKGEGDYGFDGIEFSLKDFDREALEEGTLRGTVVFPADLAASLFLIDYYGWGVSDEYQIALSLDLGATLDKSELVLLNDGKRAGSISGSFQTAPGKKGALPKDGEVITVGGFFDSMEWMNALDFENLFEQLEHTKLPSYLIDDMREEISWYW